MTVAHAHRQLPRISLLLGLLLIISALVPGVASADEAATTSANGSPNVDMEFQTIVCEDYSGVRGNTGDSPDDTNRNGEEFGSFVNRGAGGDLPITAEEDAGDCDFADEPTDFEFTFEDTSDGPDAQLLALTDAQVAFNADRGLSTTTAEDLLGADGAEDLIDEDEQLAVTVDVPTDYDFGALQCFDDARNPDNLEYLQNVGAEEATVVTCIAWLVGDLPDDEVASPPPSTGTQRPRTEVLGEQSTSDERNGQTVAVTGPAGGDIELSFADEEDETAQIVADACQALIDEHPDRPARLSSNTFIVLPSNFQEGDELTVTSTVPGDDVTQRVDYATVGTGDFQIGEAPGDVNFVTPDEIRSRLVAIRDNRGLAPDPASNDIWIDRILAGTHTIADARTAISARGAYEAAAAFQLCFVGEKPDHGSVTGLPTLSGTDLFGPVLLDDCSDQNAAPCIEGRDKDGDEVTVTATIPAEDPWMR